MTESRSVPSQASERHARQDMERGRRTRFKRATGANQTHKAGKSVQEQEHMHVADRACSCHHLLFRLHRDPLAAATAKDCNREVSFFFLSFLFSLSSSSLRSRHSSPASCSAGSRARATRITSPRWSSRRGRHGIHCTGRAGSWPKTPKRRCMDANQSHAPAIFILDRFHLLGVRPFMVSCTTLLIICPLFFVL